MPRERLHTFRELSDFQLDKDSIQLLPEKFCRRFMVVVLGKVDPNSMDAIEVGVSNAKNIDIIDKLQTQLQRPIVVHNLNFYEINKALDYAWAVNRQLSSADISISLGETDVDEKNATSLLNDVLNCAFELRATDIHIEQYRDDVDLRLRIDGILHQVSTQLSPDNVQAVVNRIKILCKMDVVERRIPQDGRFRVKITQGEQGVYSDMRVNITPGSHGEDIVIRVLGSADSLIAIKHLGLSDTMQRGLLDLLSNPEGMFFVTGPTGSGKTTTLYSALSHLNDGTKKIITAEDPIEYELPKIAQKQVSAILTYPLLARAFLRQDPDIMLIGEVRDLETAQAIARAASTGHLALSTLHTTDSFSSIIRLQTLGLSKEVISNTLLGALSQRLLRRICNNCKTPHVPTDRERQVLGALTPTKTWIGKGCASCHGTGYQGRIGVFELFINDHNIQDMLEEQRPLSELRSYAHQSGYHSLLHDGLAKVRDGRTTLEEILRALPLRYIMEMVAEK